MVAWDRVEFGWDRSGKNAVLGRCLEPIGLSAMMLVIMGISSSREVMGKFVIPAHRKGRKWIAAAG
jgi:hypothetical protein